MVGCLAIIACVILTIWIRVQHGPAYGVGAGVAGFVLLNLVGPLIDRFIDAGGQAKAEAAYDRKLQLLMAQHSKPGGLPGDLAFLLACTLLPPQKTLLARFDHVTKTNRSYLRQVRDVANASPHWQLPIPTEATESLTSDCLRRLDMYRELGRAHSDPYLQDWVERVIVTYEGWYDEKPPNP